MTASVLKQDPNTERFKRTLIYVNTDTVCIFWGEIPFIRVKINKHLFESFCAQSSTN